MMQIVYFSQRAQFISELAKNTGDTVFITPSPAKADNLRSQLLDGGQNDVVTIAKFTSDLIKTLWAEDSRPIVKRKAELLLIFGILKNKYLPELGFEQFIQAYNLFSDLRSFTLNEEALTSVLAEEVEEIRNAVHLFWKLLELTKYLDEHAAYQQIAEALRSTEGLEAKKTYVFWGFQHLNGQQVDLIKALSIRYKVIIPFPAAIRDKVKRSDWISWIKEHSTQEVVLDLIEGIPQAKWIPINSREISLKIKEELSESSQVVLGVSKLSTHHLEILPASGVGFKVQHQLLSIEIFEISDAFKEELSDEATIKDFKDWIVKKKLEFLRPSKHHMPFKKLKALQLFEEVLLAIEEMTDEVFHIDQFFKKLVKEVVLLNQPRTAFVPLLKEKADIELRDMSSLEDLDKERKVILCIDERFDEIQSLGQNYTESIQKELSALGPLKRNELELLFKQWEFQNLFCESEVVVLMSESVLKHSVIWKKLFTGITLFKHENEEKVLNKEIRDHFKNHPVQNYAGHFSASRIQSYMDCPRKFYYSYVEKISPSIELERDIDHLISGSIIHEIIEEFFKRKLEISQLSEITKEVFNRYITEKSLSLPKEVYLQRELIFNQRATNGIQFLKGIEETIKEEITWVIEKDFTDEESFKMVGSIDCIGYSSNSIFLLDFKSSESSASSYSDIENFESIQLWVYSLAAKKILPDFSGKSIVIGYVVLDDSTKSNLLFSSDELLGEFKTAKICRTKKFEEDYTDLLKAADEKIKSTVLEILADTAFGANPKKSKSCTFCELAPVCSKGEEYV